MVKAKEFFFSDNVRVNKEAIDGQSNPNKFKWENPGIHVTLTTEKTHILKALEIAFIEGIRAATGMGLMDCKKKYKEDPEYFQQFFDFQKYKSKNKLI